MSTCLEFVKELFYKPRRMGVPIYEPDIVLGDNTIVLNGGSIPEPKLSKKHLGICYHTVGEEYAFEIWMSELNTFIICVPWIILPV